MVADSDTDQPTKVLGGAPSTDEVPTKVVGASSARREQPMSGTSLGSSIEALEHDEILRTRTFAWIVMAIVCVGGVATFAVPGGQPGGKVAMIVACGSTLLAMVFLYYRTRDAVRFRRPSTEWVWYVPAVGVNAPVYYFGPFSAATMLVVLGLYFIGVGRSGKLAIIAWAICAGTQAVIVASVIISGHDPGIMHPPLTTTQQIMIAVIQQFLIAMTLVIARKSRSSALLAVGALEQAVRLAAHRQALLVEAREQLDRALRPKRGRFSEQVIGTYELGDVLGRGAMGEVYAAVDTRSGAPVAIKLLAEASLGNANHVLRFFRELRTAARVTSPHVVQVIEVGEQPVPYLVMERLEGKTLAEIARERRVLPADEVVELVSQIAIGITAAAEAGVVHRDLKPQNVFCHRGVWKLLDFGVARGVEHGDTLTAGHIVGTPSYMAPEQATGGEVDHRTDLYAIAAIAYRVLTGYAPFLSTEVAETLYRVVHTRPIRPSLLAPELHPDVDLVLAVGLAPRASDRFSTATELAEALRDALGGNLAPITRARATEILHVNGWSSSLPKGSRAS